jgi:hypothetical protein
MRGVQARPALWTCARSDIDPGAWIPYRHAAASGIKLPSSDERAVETPRIRLEMLRPKESRA